jgi:hypothetical protein
VAQLYQAALDESGTHQSSDYVVVAGYVSNAPKWNQFSEEWQAALDKWGIPAFHMTDFENRQGCFESWGEEARKSRLNSLLTMIKQHTFLSVAFVVRKRQFEEIVSEEARQLCGDAYGLAAIGCYNRLKERVKAPEVDGYIDYTMDRVSRGGGALQWMYRVQSGYPEWAEDTRMFSLSFKDKCLFLPLQAADILAYEIYKEAQRLFGNNKRPERYPFKQLRIPGRCYWHYADDAELKNVNEYLTDLASKDLKR